MTLYEARLRRAAARLAPDQAPRVVSELVDTIVELLADLPPHYSKTTVESLVAHTFRSGDPVDATPRAQLRLIIDNEEIAS